MTDDDYVLARFQHVDYAKLPDTTDDTDDHAMQRTKTGDRDV